jgi:hypothetical protein
MYCVRVRRVSLASTLRRGNDRFMPFFEPLPDSPPALDEDQLVERDWSPPRWDRPSEGTLPAIVGVSRLFVRTDDIALALDYVRVYPNGFQLVTSVMTSPRLPSALQMGGFHTVSLIAARSAPPDEKTNARPAPPLRPRPGFAMGPRLGVQFSNGQHAGARPVSPYDVDKDEEGIPTEPIITMGGGGGGSGHFRWEQWVFPLPSPGDLTVFAEWPAAGIEESSIVVSADDVLHASERAIVLWS